MPKGSYQSDNSLRTVDRLAADFGVSAPTIKRRGASCQKGGIKVIPPSVRSENFTEVTDTDKTRLSISKLKMGVATPARARLAYLGA